jgi:hypothetical protein
VTFFSVSVFLFFFFDKIEAFGIETKKKHTQKKSEFEEQKEINNGEYG